MSDPSPDQLRPPRLRRAVHRATWPLRRAAWALEEKIFWNSADRARPAIDSARWPLERLAWAIQRRAIWPAQDRFRAFKRPTQAVVATALVGAATMAGAVGALLGAPAAETATPAAAVAPAAIISASTETIRTDAPPLRGATPSFESGRTDQRQRVVPRGKATPVDEAVSAPVAPAAIDPAETPNMAMKTAERFAKAFVTYEIGKADAKVGKAFRETATASLVKALAQRPPRLPADVDVPKARVLNVVAGQRLGRTLSVSVALVRLGATSELRLQLDKTRAGWLISDVRG